MPCRDERDNDYPQYNKKLQKEIDLLQAILCSALGFVESEGLENKFFDKHDEVESGVSKLEIARWWTRHKEEDQQRRENELRALEKENLRKQALGKLSAQERRALGL